MPAFGPVGRPVRAGGLLRVEVRDEDVEPELGQLAGYEAGQGRLAGATLLGNDSDYVLHLFDAMVAWHPLASGGIRPGSASGMAEQFRQARLRPVRRWQRVRSSSAAATASSSPAASASSKAPPQDAAPFLSGMADVLETRLQQAQVEQMAPIGRECWKGPCPLGARPWERDCWIAGAEEALGDRSLLRVACATCNPARPGKLGVERFLQHLEALGLLGHRTRDWD